MAKKKVLILQNQILNYRIPVYEKLQKEYDVTVIHTGKKVSRDFNEIILNSYRIGPFSFLKNFRKSIKRINPDYILSMFDLHWPQYCLCLPKSTKNVFWGLDNGKSLIADFAKKKLVNYMRNNVLFYSKNIQEKWKEEINVKSFVAQNSVEVGEPNFTKNRNTFINVGSLHMRKRNDILLKAFASLPQQIANNTKIVLVGSGIEEQNLKKLSKALNIEEKVIFLGYVDKLEILADLYNSSICSISVGQAGLAVSQSLGFGVPFVTHKHAVTGGEIHGVVHGHNGYLLEVSLDDKSCIEELKNVMEYFWNSRQKNELYIGCREYFDKNLSLDCMVQSLIKSLTV